MKNIEEITQLLNLSILEEAGTKVSFWGSETYGAFFSDNLPDLGVLDVTKPNFPLPSLNVLATEPNKAKEKIVEVFEAYSRKGFLGKLWWRITHWSESIEDYGHFYTIIRLTELNKTYTAMLDTLRNKPDTPKYLLFTPMLDAFILYFSSFLPSHGFFNRLFQEHHQLFHTKIEDQFNYLVECIESGFNYFNDELLTAIENLNDADNNQLLIQYTANWLESCQNKLNEIPEEIRNGYVRLSNRFSEIKLILRGLIHQLSEVSQERRPQQIIISRIPEPTVNSVPVFFQPHVNLKKQTSAQNMPEDTKEGYVLWLKKIMNNPNTLEYYLNAMRKHTEQLTKEADTDLLRYSVLCQLSVCWVEAIKWQDKSISLKKIKFSLHSKEAAEDAKANLTFLWKKVFARHYHTDKNAGADEETLDEFKKTTQAFNEEKSLSCQLIDEVINMDICPDWIDGGSDGNNLDLVGKIDDLMKNHANMSVQLDEIYENLRAMDIHIKNSLDELDKRREKDREEQSQDIKNLSNTLDFLESLICTFQNQSELSVHVSPIGLFAQKSSNSPQTSLLPEQLSDDRLTLLMHAEPENCVSKALDNNGEKKYTNLLWSTGSTNISDYKDSSEGLSESDPDDEKSTVHVCNM